jgi:hypothetical protein
MRWKTCLAGLTISLLALFLQPSQILAKGIVLITWGETISHVADLPPQVKADLRKMPGMALTEPAVGYNYSYFGIFWLDLWTWGGKHCLYQGKTVWDVPANVIADMLGKSEDQLSKPWYYTFPPGLLIVVGIVALVVVLSFFGKTPEEKVKLLLEDKRYQRALEILSEESKKEEAAAAARAQAQSAAEAQVAGLVPAEAPAAQEVDKPYAAALNHLIGEGIPPPEAQQNLNLIVTLAGAAAPETPG